MGSRETFPTNGMSSLFGGRTKSPLESASLSTSMEDNSAFTGLERSLRATGALDSFDSELNRLSTLDTTAGNNSSKSYQDFSANPSSPVGNALDITSAASNIKNSAVALWDSLLNLKTPLKINLVVEDLPAGQLAEAQITRFDEQGRPSGGTIRVDDDANGKGWFIDPTPFDNSEFDQGINDWTFIASADSEAKGRYDMLTVMLHEVGHLAGFISGYSGFESHIETQSDSRLFVTDNLSATLNGDHLDPNVYPTDLLNPIFSPSVRNLPSTLDVQLLNAVRSYEGENTLGTSVTAQPELTISSLAKADTGVPGITAALVNDTAPSGTNTDGITYRSSMGA